MHAKILFIPPTPEALPACKQDILDICQKIGRTHVNFYFLCDKPDSGVSIYANTPRELTEPIKELSPCIVEQWRPIIFQRHLKKENFSHCIFFAPEVLAQKLIPLTMTNNIKTFIFEKRSFFQACPITDKVSALFRGSSYALADTLLTPYAVTAATWRCAGFPNAIKVPENDSDWEKLLLDPRAFPHIVSAYDGLRVFEEVFATLEQSIPLIRGVDRIQIIDSRKPWQKNLEEVIDKVLPCGSLRRKLVKNGCKAVWRTIKFFKFFNGK